LSYYHVQPPRHARIAWSAAALAVGLLLAVASLAGWASVRPLQVSVDGTPHRIAPGTTAGDLQRRGVFAARAGRVLGIDGSVVATVTGAEPRLLRNGLPAQFTQRLYDGDVLTSRPGPDQRESLIVTDVPIPFGTVTQGKGSILSVQSPGLAGVRRVTRGEFSGVETTSVIVTEPTPMIVQATGPRPGMKLVALTFDDGPWAGQTDKILDILAAENVHATFFVVGNRVKLYPDLVRRTVEEGHQIANHSWSHRNFADSSNGQVWEEVVSGQRAIQRATGTWTPWIRPPYGAMNGRVYRVMKQLGQRTVLWDVDTGDWTKPGGGTIVKRTLRAVKPGSVVLMHDGGSNNRRQTIAALPAIIHELKKRGYEFVTVSEMAAVSVPNDAKGANVPTLPADY